MRVHSIVFHHSAAWGDPVGLPDVQGIVDAHLAKHWRTAGYHCIVDRRGDPHYFRRLGETPAAQGAGNNTGTYAVCGIGWNGPTSPVPVWRWTRAQIKTMRALVDSIRLLDPEVSIKGHRDFKATICPGLESPALVRIMTLGVRA